MSEQLYAVAGAVLVGAGAVMALSSLVAMGDADTWDRAAEIAADAMHPSRRLGMISAALAFAVSVPAAAAVVARLHGTPGFVPAAGSYLVFATGAFLFAMLVGLVSIAMPALGEMAARGLDVQAVADAFTRQPAIIAAFLGANAMYLAWAGLAFALGRSGLAPGWLPWTIGALAIAGWLRFLHVPGFQQFAGAAWPLAIATVGAWLWWVRA